MTGTSQFSAKGLPPVWREQLLDYDLTTGDYVPETDVWTASDELIVGGEYSVEFSDDFQIDDSTI